jgi:hypothetical protein
METKKGQGLSIRMIIILILGLIAMAVVLFIFSDKIGFFNLSTTNVCSVEDCEDALSGRCPPNTAKGVGIYTSDVTESDIEACNKKAKKKVVCCVSLS